MALKLEPNGTRSIVNFNGKIDAKSFPMWNAAQVVVGKSTDATSVIFDLNGKSLNRKKNEEATKKVGADVYGTAYIIHPDMVSARIRTYTKEEIQYANTSKSNKDSVTEQKKESANTETEKAKEEVKTETAEIKGNEMETEKITGEEAIELLDNIGKCPIEALEVLKKYCRCPIVEIDMRLLIDNEINKRKGE